MRTTKRKTIRNIYGLIEDLLQHRTRNNPITSRQICEELFIKDISGWPVTRELILKTMKETGTTIGACGGGYFLISDIKELNEYTESLQKRADSILDRISIVRDSYYLMNEQD